MTTKPYTKSKRKFNSFNKTETTSAETPSNKKRALKQARQSHRPHSEVVSTAKELWNKLRLKSNTKDDISKLMEELMVLLRGKFNRIALQHDASRVVQSAIQFGTKEQRVEIVTEICSGSSGNSGDGVKATGNIVELAKSQYSHFVVLKMIKYCKDETSVNFLVKSFKGHICKLAVHAVGARVIELLFATLPPKSTTKLKLEVYGPRFTLFTDSGTLSNTSTHPTLQSIIQDQSSSNKAKDAALESLSSIIHKGIDKGLFSFAYFQQLLCEYVTVAPPSDVRALCPSLVDHSIHLLSTRSGSRVVAECAAYGTPKDRKRIMKSLKGYTRSSLLHTDAYIAILRLCDVTDDTVTVQKSILAELQVRPNDESKKKKTVGPPESDDDNDDNDGLRSPIIELALSETGSKLLLLLLAKDDESRKKYFDPAELEVLRPNPTITENGEEVPTSKKNSKTRRMELLQYMKKILVQLCELHTDELLRSRCGSKVIKEIHDTYSSKELTKVIVDACDSDRDTAATESDNKTIAMSMFEHPIGHLSIKNILLNESTSSPSNTKRENLLSSELCLRFKGKLVEKIASSNRGAFVLAAMVEVDDNTRKEIATDKVKKLIKVCKKDKKPVAGFEALLKALKK